MTTSEEARIWSASYSFLIGGIDEAARHMEILGIDIKEFLVLDGIETLPYPVDLGKRLSIPKATMSGYIKELEVRGHLARKFNPDDLRRHRLCLTASGIEKVAQGRLILGRVFEERLRVLEDDERQEFKRLLEKVVR